MTDIPRLIEFAFPLQQASLDSVHEKNVRHGHISTLHIWPARRPLAACRAALIATLLPDPGTPEERKKLCEKIGGKVIQKVEKKAMPNGQKVERIKEETEGGILHWKRETENAEDLQWFRDEIRKAYGGRAPKVLDPFAGGWAIPLEAMRLGCETTAIDINPVAWFILKCTLEYPQKLAGQKRSLPRFILSNREFMEDFFKAQGIKGAALRKQLEKLGFKGGRDQALAGLKFEDHTLDADLAWHVRAWGEWVLDRARRKLARFYPTYADFMPLKKGGPDYQPRPMQLVPLRDDGTPDIDAMNAGFTAEHLGDPRNARWVVKPTVAYLWARTVKCKHCRATVPLVKTQWLCKKDQKRVLLTMLPNADGSGVLFGVEDGVPVCGGNSAQRREHDKRIGGGSMSRSGAQCPCCPTIMTMEDIRLEGQAGRLGSVLTAVVVNGQDGKEFRLPTQEEIATAEEAASETRRVFDTVPFGVPDEPMASKEALGFRVPLYGFDKWSKLFTSRQLMSLGTLTQLICSIATAPSDAQYPPDWKEAIAAYLGVALDRTANYMSTICIWEPVAAEIKQTFLRFALPITWDYAEANPLAPVDRFFNGAVSNIVRVISELLPQVAGAPAPRAINQSAIAHHAAKYDVVVTDPPYYDAIPYSDLMDFFYVWLRRTLYGVSPEMTAAFASKLGPKWDATKQDGELIDDSSRHCNDEAKSKAAYEDGMFRAFASSCEALNPNGRLVIVFANKQPAAWETLVAALIRAGFVVDGSWPIMTEMRGGVRNFNRASLASSVWLVCKKRLETARPGWDNRVLDEMRENIRQQLRDFWDAGIRGPDFVWAATGPALEAYSKYPVVKKANEPGQIMSVTEFLHQVRRLVVDFVVGRVLSGDGGGEDMSAAERLDDVTAYYLLHRHDFGLADVPVGGCILYAISCGLSDRELGDTWDILSRTGGTADEDEEAEEADPDEAAEAEEGSGSKVKLKTWAQRNRKSMGYEAPGGRPVPLIDRLHRLMHLWRAGDSAKVDEYLDNYGLRRHELFQRLLQSLIELSPAGSDERATLESISNHVGAKGAKPRETMPLPGMATSAESEDQ